MVLLTVNNRPQGRIGMRLKCGDWPRPTCSASISRPF